MPISCPSGLVSVAVNAAARTVCIQGTVAVTLEDQHFGVPAVDDPPPVIVVIVVAGHTNQAAANPPALGTVQVAPSGDSWCARNVSVPNVSAMPPGAPLTAIAWQLDANGVVQDISVQPFNGLDSTVGGTNCCAGCGSGYGSGSTSTSSAPSLSSVLADTNELLISLPDGESAGNYSALRSDEAQWTMILDDTEYLIAIDATGTELTLTGPGVELESLTVLFNPFSATFDGAALGANNDLVVTQA